jgi:hypothetical protein
MGAELSKSFLARDAVRRPGPGRGCDRGRSVGATGTERGRDRGPDQARAASPWADIGVVGRGSMGAWQAHVGRRQAGTGERQMGTGVLHQASTAFYIAKRIEELVDAVDLWIDLQRLLISCRSLLPPPGRPSSAWPVGSMRLLCGEPAPYAHPSYGRRTTHRLCTIYTYGFPHIILKGIASRRSPAGELRGDRAEAGLRGQFWP